MTDLRTRMRVFDQVPTPDYWADAEGRASTAPLAFPSARRVRPALLLVAVLSAILTISAAVAIGSGLIDLPVIVPVLPSPYQTILPTPPEEPSEDLGIFAPVAGQIVYGDEHGIWGVDPAAPTNRIQLTSGAGTPLGWSGDGTRLLIQRDLQLLVLHADGSETMVTELPAESPNTPAAISPDGSRVVFAGYVETPEGDCRCALYAVNADGGPAEVLFESQGVLWGLTFSPDGTRIAYVQGAGDHSNSVWMIDADGSDAFQIVSNEGDAIAGGHVRGLAWSPTGDQIALGLGGSIYTFAPDGSDFTQIAGGDTTCLSAPSCATNLPRSAESPYWSPDGFQIAYTTGCINGAGAADRAGCNLAIADADGSDVRAFGLGAAGPWHPGTLETGDSPSAAQTAVAHFPVFPGPPRPVDAGIYDMGPDFPVSVSFVVPAGWLSCVNNAGFLCLADGVGEVTIDIVTNVVADPCKTTLRDPSVGPTLDDLVTAISSLPWSAVTPPTDVIVDSIRGKEFEATAPTGSACAGDASAVWVATLNGRVHDVSPGERNRLRILYVHGTRVVIAGSYRPGITSSQDLAEINAIIDSVRIETDPPG